MQRHDINWLLKWKLLICIGKSCTPSLSFLLVMEITGYLRLKISCFNHLPLCYIIKHTIPYHVPVYQTYNVSAKCSTNILDQYDKKYHTSWIRTVTWWSQPIGNIVVFIVSPAPVRIHVILSGQLPNLLSSLALVNPKCAVLGRLVPLLAPGVHSWCIVELFRDRCGPL